MNWQTYTDQALPGIRAIFGTDESIVLLRRVAEHICRKPFHQIRSDIMSDEEMQQADRWVAELSVGKPLQYLTGTAWFYKYPFKVNASVLIPRPETEELIEWMLQDMNHEMRSDKSYRVLDIGTGSGCIPVTLKKQRPRDLLLGIDVSEEALQVARQNVKDLESDIELRAIDFLEEDNWTNLEQYDYIISNPPYIPLHEKELLGKQVRDFEPHLALFVPDNDPLIFYKKIARFGMSHLASGGAIYVELHQQLAEATRKMFIETGYLAVTVKKDISGNERMLRARR